MSDFIFQIKKYSISFSFLVNLKRCNENLHVQEKKLLHAAPDTHGPHCNALLLTSPKWKHINAWQSSTKVEVVSPPLCVSSAWDRKALFILNYAMQETLQVTA